MISPTVLNSIVLCILLTPWLLGCGTRTGNGFVNLDFQSYTQGNRPAHFVPLLDSVSEVKFCFKRLRFKTEGEATASNPEQDEDNFDFSLGEVTLSPNGTSLGNVKLPAGVYRRIEFDLEDKCTSGKSIQLVNGNGSFSTSSRITIKFNGSFTMVESDKRLGLAAQSIVDALANVSSDSQIRSAVEAVSSNFQERD